MFTAAKHVTMFLVFALTTAGLTSLSTSTAEAKACSTHKVTTIKLTAKGVHTRYVREVTWDGKVKIEGMRTIRKANVGAPKIAVTTCKSPKTGKWSILRASFTDKLYDLTMEEEPTSVTMKPRTGDYGWGVFARAVKKNAIALRISKCVKDPAPLSVLGVVHGLLGLPIPLKSGYAVGLYVVDKALPAAPEGQYRCATMDDESMTLSIGGNRSAHPGKVYVNTSSVAGKALTEKSYNCNINSVCTLTNQEIVTVRRS
jgi:hypothetical protein